MFTGRIALPVCADAVIIPLTPTFTVATANAPVPFAPGIFTMPSLLSVTAMATMSVTGVAEAEKRRVLTPEMIGACSVLAHLKLNCTSVGAIGAVGINPKANLWAAPAGMSMGP